MFQRNRKDLLLEIVCYIAVLIHGITSDGFYLKESPTSKQVEEGYKTSFQCLAAPSDHIIYKWSHNDRPIALNHHRYLGADKRTLLFDHVDRDIDSGAYSCLAQNSSSKFARKSRYGKLEVNWLEPELNIEMLQPSSEANLKRGGNLLLKCHTNAFPKISKDITHWFFNGNRDLPSDIIIQSDGTLTIESMQPSHNGFFHCRILHSAGKLDSLTPFILSVNGQSLQSSEFSKYIKEGATVSLKCPWINEKVIWSKILRLGDPLTLISPDSIANILVKEGNLTITGMDKDTVAYYLCQKVDKSPTKTAIFRVSLAKMYDFKREQFSPALDDTERLIIREGETGGIRFYNDLSPLNSFLFDNITNPTPTITWKYNNIELPNWSGDTLVPAPRKHVLRNRHLVIANATLKDRGDYVIKMENVDGRRERRFMVEVTFPPSFDEAIERPPFLSINEDDAIALYCHIKKMSPEDTTKIYWKKDGITIVLYTEGYTHENDGQTLRINRAKSEHSGVYQCFVKTLGFPDIHNKPQNISIKAKLQFTGLNVDVHLEVNKNGSVHCKTKGFGQILTTWYHLSVTESEHSSANRGPILYPHYVHDNGTLVLRNVQREYSGEYFCEARSYITKEVINKTVKVKVGEMAKIIKITTNLTIQEGSTLVMDCLATGDPKPIINWLMDNSMSQTMNQKQIISFDSNQPDKKQQLINGTLIIRNVGLTEESKYTCYASNPLGIAEETITVKVLTPEEYSKFKQNSNFNKGMLKTIIIVVSCALAYLALIIGLTAFCSLRMLKHKRNRSLTALNLEKHGDNCQLMRPMGSSNPNGGCKPNDKMVSKLPRNKASNSAASNYLPQVPFTTTNSYFSQYNQTSLPNYLINPIIDGSEFQHLMSAPPPTPLESRSSTNSASLYTRSHLSSSTNGGATGIGMNSMERLTYPRHELQTEGVIGKGEFGDVFLARARNIQDRETQSLVVVKSLMHNIPSNCHEFHRQLDMFARTESDFVTKLLGICIEIEPCLLILEYCEWGDLKQFLRCVQDRSKPSMPVISRQQKVSLCAQISLGMDHISAIRCVHKDLAIRNVLVTPQLNVKISHLGLCRDIYQGEYYQDGDHILPIRWMPPESVLKNEFSLQTDVWSFAVTCWEIFSMGALPMSAYKNEEILDILASCSSLTHSKVQTMYSSLEQFPLECPLTVVSVIKRCLFIDPQNRPNFTDICKSMKEPELPK